MEFFAPPWTLYFIQKNWLFNAVNDKLIRDILREVQKYPTQTVNIWHFLEDISAKQKNII